MKRGLTFLLSLLFIVVAAPLRADHGAEDARAENAEPPYGRQYQEYWKPRYDGVVTYFEKFSVFGMKMPPKLVDAMLTIRSARESLADSADPTMEQSHLARLLDDHAFWIDENKAKMKSLRAGIRNGVKAEVNRRGKMIARYLFAKGRDRWNDVDEKLFGAIDAIAKEADGKSIQAEEILETDFENENLAALLKTVEKTSQASATLR